MRYMLLAAKAFVVVGVALALGVGIRPLLHAIVYSSSLWQSYASALAAWAIVMVVAASLHWLGSMLSRH